MLHTHADSSTLSLSGSAFSSFSSTFLSFHQPSREFEWDGFKSMLLFCRGCTVWVATITQGERNDKEDEKKRGIRGKCVSRVYTVSLMCIQEGDCFRSFSDSEQSQVLLWRQEVQVVIRLYQASDCREWWKPVLDSSQVRRQWTWFRLESSSTLTYRCYTTSMIR